MSYVEGVVFVNSCTSKNPAQCSAKARGYFILPPVLSGRQTTEDSLYFRYGILEVTAKLPSGDWVVPGNILLSTISQHCFQTVICGVDTTFLSQQILFPIT